MNPIHYSDCAVHNEPAMRNGPCNCGLEWKIKFEPMDTLPRDATILLAVKARDSHPWLAGKPPRVHAVYVDEDGRLCDTGKWKPDLGYDGPSFHPVGWMSLPMFDGTKP